MAAAQEDRSDPLPSWNDGPAKQAILRFVRDTTDKASDNLVPAEQRIVAFDQDGTLWVEQPMYTQVMYCIDRVPAAVARQPELMDVEPFKTALAGDRAALAKLPVESLVRLVGVTMSGMSDEEFTADVQQWVTTTRHPRWDRPYAELTYRPMQEALRFFRGAGYKTYIVTGGSQDFVRAYAEKVYGIPPELVVGTMEAVKFGYDQTGRPLLTREPRLLLNNDRAGKPEGIHLLIGRRPRAAFGNSIGDRQMLEYTTAGGGARLGMLLLHDDAAREYAYGPARGLRESRIGTFPQSLDDEAAKRGWVIISMKGDWKRVFAFEK